MPRPIAIRVSRKPRRACASSWSRVIREAPDMITQALPAPKISRAVIDITPAILLGLICLLFWEGAIWLFKIEAFVLPAPSAIAVVMVDQFPTLAVAALVTAEEILIGFALSAITGVLVAIVIARFETFGRALYPLIVLFQNVPKVALAPIFILWFGYDLAPKVLLIVVIAFFPVAIGMLSGLQSV